MEFTRLGKSGLKVSRLCMGCMTYGEPNQGNHAWTLPEDQSRPLLRQALEAGINFFDTANVYSNGSSEEILGRAIRDFARRDEVVIATKVNGPMRQDPNAGGLSRKAIMTEIDHSLRRLGTDYVDLYQVHRWDYSSPIEETLEALHDVVKAGKARYIGASSMYAYQFAKSLYMADLHGWTRYISMQNHYNLLHRDEEREMMRLCAEEGVGVMPWSPLARGRLTRDISEQTFRSQNDKLGKRQQRMQGESDHNVAQAVAEVAAARGVPRAQVALSWVMHKSPVTAPIVGASKTAHLDDAVAALSLKLTVDEVAKLEAPYVFHTDSVLQE
ncbi:aldo/keto reductase [Ottowia thiooxydans]|uniref:aldo/keto reductase n=1 Tax=Ottowia thiooxydans TaxID=219182 RepID=UPI000408DF71|nr:aldo/keto reductase [Ottowia thiooxydans]